MRPCLTINILHDFLICLTLFANISKYHILSAQIHQGFCFVIWNLAYHNILNNFLVWLTLYAKSSMYNVIVWSTTDHISDSVNQGRKSLINQTSVLISWECIMFNALYPVPHKTLNRSVFNWRMTENHHVKLNIISKTNWGVLIRLSFSDIQQENPKSVWCIMKLTKFE